MRRLLALVVVLALAAIVVRPDRALAHAALVRADPPENAFVQRPPTEIILTFNEPVDSRLSSIRLLDAAGKPISAAGPVQFGKSTMQLPLQGLTPGIYNVLWANVSSVDGHALQGAYPFTVLQPDGSLPNQVNSVGGLSSNADPPPQSDGVAVRGLGLLGLILATAGPIILLIGGTAVAGLRRWLTGVVLLGAAVLGVATILNFAVIRDTYSGLGLHDVVLNTRAGNYWLARGGAVLLLAVLATFVGDAPKRAATAMLAAVLAFLWSYSATSHAAAGAGSNWATALDLVHGAAAVTWIGGVLGLALAARIKGSAGVGRSLLGRFRVTASLAVFLLLATGTLAAFIEIDRPAQLTDTRYGVTLLVKLGLMAALLAVAAYNARWGRKRLAENAAGEPRRFLATATAEILLGVAVFATAATLTQSTASKLIPETRQSKPFDQTSRLADINVRLQVDPNHTGLNVYRATLSDGKGAAADAERVRLTFNYRDDQTVGPSSLVLAHGTDAGVFSGQGPYLTLEGDWRIQVEVRRKDVDDAVAFFEVRPAGTAVNRSLAGGPWDDPAPGLSWNQFGGLAALIVGLGLALFKGQVTRFGRRYVWGANGTTAVMFGLGTLLLFGVHTHETLGTSLPKNPIYPDQNSIATGRQIFIANCAGCHGLNGVPPKGLPLNPYPLDLTVHAPLHPEGQLFLFVRDGIAGSSMRSWGSGDGKLTTEQIWHVVNYLQTLRPVNQ